MSLPYEDGAAQRRAPFRHAADDPFVPFGAAMPAGPDLGWNFLCVCQNRSARCADEIDSLR